MHMDLWLPSPDESKNAVVAYKGRYSKSLPSLTEAEAKRTGGVRFFMVKDGMRQ
jgi:hypothetical protein